MKPIDLVPFAEHSQKLPAPLLTPASSVKTTSAGKVLSAHLIDFGTVFVLTSFMAAIFSVSMGSMMVTKGLRSVFSEQMVFGTSGTLLPFMAFNYFFFSYFLNDGQTYGMFLLKNRMEMRTKSFIDALKGAAHSVVLCFSCGTSFFAQKRVWDKLRGHDYLYDALFAHKDEAPVDLLSKIDGFESEKFVEEEESWKKAA